MKGKLEKNKKTMFDNKNFWNERYETNIKLGSGRGSRGKFIKMKETLVDGAVKQYNVESVLDIGCGDCEVNKNIRFKKYTGTDVSDYVIERNSILFPQRSFILANFDDLTMSGKKYDMVICFDVLIHQPNLADYRKGITAIKNSFNKVALVSGFEKFKTKGICYFYESICDSFSEYNVEILTRFHQQTLLKITKND